MSEVQSGIRILAVEEHAVLRKEKRAHPGSLFAFFEIFFGDTARLPRVAWRSQLWRATVGLSVALTIAPVPGCAVGPDQPATSYIRTTFTVEDGLSSNVVNAILQTRDGFLWIGTDAGLNRFDGRHFTPIYFRGPESTPQGVVSALAEGPDGDLWIGTSAGLVRISRQALDQFDRSLSVFYHPGAGISDEITSLLVGRDGTLWVGTSAGLYRFLGNQLQSVTSNTAIDRMEEGVDGHLLIVTNHGFVELDGTRVIEHSGLAHQLGVVPEAIFHVFQDRKGAVWFSTSAGLARLVNGSLERFQAYGQEGHGGVLHVYEDPQGNLWVEASTSAQTTGGIFRVSGTKLELLEPSTQVRITPISADREGNLWIGTNGQGLIRFKDRPIRMFTKANGLPNNIPMTVLSKSDGSLWVGNNCGGLSVFNGNDFKTYDERDGLSNSCVWALAEGQSGELWVGTWGGGLFRFANGHFAQFTSRQGLADSVVRAIITAHDGSLWIATENGLSHMANGHFHNYTAADGLSSNRVVSVYQDRHGTIWVGTSRGINRMTGDRFAPVLSQRQIFDPRYISFAEDSSSELYAISAPKGIDRIEGNRLVEVNHDLDLLSMASSPSGELWFTGGNGIFRFSAAAFEQNQGGEEPPLDYAPFGTADGMLSTQCSIGAPNMALAADGKLWAATVQGLAMLDLQLLSFDSAKSTIFVEDVTVGRARQPAGRELVLAPGTHHVELRFDSISLASPEKIRFQYRMNGVDPFWLDAGNAHTAVYTKIPVGTHAFRIRSCNSAGVWDRSGISFSVTQEPYFYETGWFRASCATGLVILLWVLYAFRLRKATAAIAARLGERLQERERIARELHDTLLQDFQAMILRFHSISRRLVSGDPNRLAMDEGLRYADKVLAEGRNRIRDIRSDTKAPQDLSKAFADYANELSQLRPVKFDVKVTGMPIEIDPIVRDEIYRVGREAIGNAFKHSDCSTIEIELTYDPREFQMRIQDDGRGIDPAILTAGGKPGHWGMYNMRERAQKIGASLEFSNPPNAGTTLTLKLPLSSLKRGLASWFSWRRKTTSTGLNT